MQTQHTHAPTHTSSSHIVVADCIARPTSLWQHCVSPRLASRYKTVVLLYTLLSQTITQTRRPARPHTSQSLFHSLADSHSLTPQLPHTHLATTAVTAHASDDIVRGIHPRALRARSGGSFFACSPSTRAKGQAKGSPRPRAQGSHGVCLRTLVRRVVLLPCSQRRRRRSGAVSRATNGVQLTRRR
jgi:hypothetical protein